MTPNKSRDTFSPYRITMFQIENLCSNLSTSRWTSPTASSSIQPKDFMPRLCPTGHILRPQRPPARPFQVGRYECVFPSPPSKLPSSSSDCFRPILLGVSFSLPPLLATGASSSVNGMCVTGSQIDIVSSPDGQATHKVHTYAAAIWWLASHLWSIWGERHYDWWYSCIGLSRPDGSSALYPWLPRMQFRANKVLGSS